MPKLSSLTLAILLLSLSWSCAPVTQNSTQTSRQENSGPSYPPNYLPEIELTLEDSLGFESSRPTEPTAQKQAPLAVVALPEEMTPPEPEATVNIEIEELDKLGSWEEEVTNQVLEQEREVEYDFPITINRQVEYYLDFFQNRNKNSFQRWLTRSGRYLPMIKAELKKAGLPQDLAYLPMIESGYSLTAYSRAKAVGMWQFMRATGINFGLKVNNYVDERRDPIKSTKAAIAYLKILHAEFNSWELAVAGYNAGEGRIRRGIKKFKTNNFWKLAEQRFLPSETKRYVPKLVAAIIIAKSPEKYGFDAINYAAPLNFEYAKVPRWTSIRAVAVALECDFKELHTLNRELKKLITPPDHEYYNIKIPAGTKELLAENLPRVHATVTTKFKTHTVTKGETLSRICRKYNINKTTLLKANNLHKAKITAGKRLRIPHQTTQYVLLSEEEMQAGQVADRDNNFLLHKIQPGETVAKIAQRYGVSPNLIAAWNGLKSIHKIRAGQQLALYIDSGSQPIKISAKRASPAAEKTSSANSMVTLSGSKKRAVAQKVAAAPAAASYYQVKNGDSLWRIARRFNLHTTDIKRWNKLKNNTIQPGLKLILKAQSGV